MAKKVRCPILLLDVAPNDRGGMRKWLKDNAAEYDGTAWFARVTDALNDGEDARAWRLAMAASMRTVARAGTGALTAAQRASVRNMAMAQVLGRTRKLNQFQTIVEPPPIPRAAGGKGVRPGFGGVLQPPPVRRPLKTGQTDALLGRATIQSLLRESLPERIVLGKTNVESEARLFSQIAEQSILGINSKEMKRLTGLTDVELASHMKRAVSTAARIMNDFSQWRAANIDNIKVVDEIMLKGGVDEDDLIRLGRGRFVRGSATNETLSILAEEGWSLEKVQALMAVSKPAVQASKTAAVTSFSRGFMISQFATAMRNFITQGGRYAVGTMDQALGGMFDMATGDFAGGKAKLMFADQLFRGPVRAGRMLVNNRFRPWTDNLQEMFDFNTRLLEGATNPDDMRRSLAVLNNFPTRSAQFLGYAAGEAQRDLNVVTGNAFIDGMVNNQRFRNWLTVFNRAQEFPSRATVFDGVVRKSLRERGFNPNQVLVPDFDGTGAISRTVIEKLDDAIGADGLDRVMSEGVLTALDWTFAGQAAKGSVSNGLINILNRIPVFRDLAFPFPRFNLVSAARFVYEHSPAGLLEIIRQPWAAFPGPVKSALRVNTGRLNIGRQARKAEREWLPEIIGKSQVAEVDHARAVTQLAEVRRELGVRKRMLRRAERKAERGQELDGGRETNVEAAQIKVDELQAAADESFLTVKQSRDRLGALLQQEKNLQDTIEAAQAIGAPTSTGDVLARAGTGMAMLTGMIALRSSQMAEGTEWSQLRVPSPFGNTVLIDMRPFAPILSPGLLVADVIVDFHDNTDWEAVRRGMGQADEAGQPIDPLAMTELMYQHYEGKYPAGRLGIEFAEAFLSISRASGTTLSILDLAEGYGLDPELAVQALIGTIGQFIGRFTIPFRPLKDIAGQFIEDEAITRIPPDSRQTFELDVFGDTIEVPLVGPLLAPLQNIPFAGRVIPERISPFTGEARRSIEPAVGQFTGLRATEQTDIQREFVRIGVPGRSMYLERSGSVEVDNLAATYYSAILGEVVPQVMAHRRYQALKTPASQRDFWQRTMLPRLKRIVRAQLINDLGLSRFEDVTLSDEEKRQRMRWLRAIERLEELQPLSPDVDTVDLDGSETIDPLGGPLGAGPPPLQPVQ